MLPPFRADHVGSLIRPQALIEAREEAETGGDRASLKRIQEQAIRDVVAMQQDIGLNSSPTASTIAVPGIATSCCAFPMCG